MLGLSNLQHYKRTSSTHKQCIDRYLAPVSAYFWKLPFFFFTTQVNRGTHVEILASCPTKLWQKLAWLSQTSTLLLGCICFVLCKKMLFCLLENQAASLLLCHLEYICLWFEACKLILTYKIKRRSLLKVQYLSGLLTLFYSKLQLKE